MMNISPIHPDFVGEVWDLDISVPLSGDLVTAIEAGWIDMRCLCSATSH